MNLGIRQVVASMLVCTATVFGAEEGKANDFGIRISLGNAPGVEELDLDSAGTISLEDDGGGEIDILVVNRFWSSEEARACGVLGGGIFFARHSGKEGTDQVDLTAFGFIGQGGLAVRAGSSVVFELGPYFGIGVAEQEITGFSDGSGAYFMYGLKGGIFVALGSNVELGLELGYGGFANQVEFDFGGFTEDGQFNGDGARAAAAITIML